MRRRPHKRPRRESSRARRGLRGRAVDGVLEGAVAVLDPPHGPRTSLREMLVRGEISRPLLSGSQLAGRGVAVLRWLQ